MKFDGPGEITPEKDLDGDWRFIILSDSHYQSQVTVGNSNKCSDVLVFIKIDSWKRGVHVDWWNCYYELNKIYIILRGLKFKNI